MTVRRRSLQDEVTVLVITRNRAGMLRQALASVAAQQGGPVDVVVVDDASVDHTPAVAAEFPRVRVVRQERPRGPAVARNAGLDEIRTPWVAFLDDDDVWAPDKLLVQQRALAADPQARWCHTGAMAVDAILRPIGAMHAGHRGDVRVAVLAANVICGGGSSVYAHTATVRAVGGFDLDVRRHEDWDLWIRLALASPLVAVDRPLVGFRRHAVSRSSASVQDDAVALLSRYAGVRRGLGVTKFSRRPLQAVHDNPLLPGSRTAFARGYFLAGAHHRSLRLLAAGGGSLVCPRLLARASRWLWRTRSPAGWFEEVATWLPALAQVSQRERHAADVGR